MKMGPGFGMNCDDVGSGLGKGIEQRIDRRNHQMNVEGEFAVRTKRLHNCRTDGEVRNEMAIHDVDVNPVRSRRIDRADLLAEPSEIGGKDGRGDDRGAGALDHGPD